MMTVGNITGPSEPTDAYVQYGQPLSPRQTVLMDLLVKGMTNKEIADCMGIGIRGVEAHIKNIMFKAGLGRRVLLALWWYKAGIAALGCEDVCAVTVEVE